MRAEHFVWSDARSSNHIRTFTCGQIKQNYEEVNDGEHKEPKQQQQQIKKTSL